MIKVKGDLWLPTYRKRERICILITTEMGWFVKLFSMKVFSEQLFNFRCFDGPTQSGFCWMFLLFLFKSKTRQRKVWDSHWLIIISTHIRMSVNFSVFLDVDSYRVEVSQSLTKPSHTSVQKPHLRGSWSYYYTESSKDLNVWVKLVGHIAGLTGLFIVVFLRNNLNNWSSLYIFCPIWK